MKFSIGILSAAALAATVQATWLDKPSLVTYWGQDSKNGANTQLSLASYCDSNSDVIILSFTLGFSNGNLPTLNLAGTCDSPNFPGTTLLSCPDVGADIKTCQSKGKTILMSLGGAVGQYGFANDANGQAFADTLWNIYGAGNSTTRPFGDAVIDGFDLDIEGGGPTGYAAMVTQLRSHFAKDTSKRYYITGAPQCPFPDAMMGTVIDDVGFDAVNVQFYNNYCSTTSTSFNFATWQNWATTTSPNKNVKVLLGLPGSSTAAGSGYVPFAQLQPIVKSVYQTYSSFGGIMIWDASEVYANTDVSPNYETAVAGLVHGLSGGAVATTTTTKSSTTTTKSSTTTTKLSSSISKTTTSASPTATSSPGSCPVNGGSCPTSGAYACAGSQFAICSNGAWVLQSCSSGTTCFSTTDGSSIYCGQGSGGSTCSAASAAVQARAILSKPTIKGPTAKPFTSSHVTAQISVSSAVPGSNFAATINARVLDTTVFGKTITVKFQVATNVKVTSVENGTVEQKGSNVKMIINNADTETKAVIINFAGRATSGVFTVPNVDTMSIV